MQRPAQVNNRVAHFKKQMLQLAAATVRRAKARGVVLFQRQRVAVGLAQGTSVVRVELTTY